MVTGRAGRECVLTAERRPRRPNYSAESIRGNRPPDRRLRYGCFGGAAADGNYTGQVWSVLESRRRRPTRPAGDNSIIYEC